jgi:hypothetical protein
MSIRTTDPSTSPHRGAVDMSALDVTTIVEVPDILDILAGGEITPDMLLAVATMRLRDLDGQIEGLMASMNANTARATEISERLSRLREISMRLEPAYSGNEVNPNAVLDGVSIDQQASLDEFFATAVANGNLTQAEADSIRASPDGLRNLISAVDDFDPLRATQIHNMFQDRGLADASGNYTPDRVTVGRYLESLVADGTLTDAERQAILADRGGLDDLISATNEELRENNSGNELLMISLQSTMQARTAIITATTNLMKTLDEGNDAVVANLR